MKEDKNWDRMVRWTIRGVRWGGEQRRSGVKMELEDEARVRGVRK